MRLKIENGSAEQNPATAPLFIINPLSGRGLDNLFSTHPSTENRIAALDQLAQEWASLPMKAGTGMTDGIVTVQAFLEIKVAKVVEQSSLLSHSPRLAPRPYPLP